MDEQNGLVNVDLVIVGVGPFTQLEAALERELSEIGDHDAGQGKREVRFEAEVMTSDPVQLIAEMIRVIDALDRVEQQQWNALSRRVFDVRIQSVGGTLSLPFDRAALAQIARIGASLLVSVHA